MSTYQKMNPEVKRVWINELRSGRYKQSTEWLRDGDAFCCLGVLCDLSGAGKWNSTEYNGEGELAPNEVIEWAGLHGDYQRRLAKMNDDGKSFAKIADWIEKYL